MSQMKYLNSSEKDSLEHYGVKGMKWGVIRSRKELGYDDSPKKKKGSSTESGLMSKRQVRKIQKERLKVEAKKRKEKQAAREKEKKEKEIAAKKASEIEEIKEKLKTSSDPEFIYKHRSLLTTQELNDRIDRINKEKTLKSLIANKDNGIKDLENFLNRTASMTKSVASISESLRKITGESKENTAERIRKEQLKQAKIKTAKDKLSFEKEKEENSKTKKEAEKKAAEAGRNAFQDFMSSSDRYDFSKNYNSTGPNDSKQKKKEKEKEKWKGKGTDSSFSSYDAFRQAKDVYDKERSTTLSTVDSWSSSSSSTRAKDFIDEIVAVYDEHGRRIR